jgi:hypothetical protein
MSRVLSRGGLAKVRRALVPQPSTKVREIAAMLKAIHAGEDVAAAREKAIRVIEKLRGLRLSREPRRRAVGSGGRGDAHLLCLSGGPEEHRASPQSPHLGRGHAAANDLCKSNGAEFLVWIRGGARVCANRARQNLWRGLRAGRAIVPLG